MSKQAIQQMNKPARQLASSPRRGFSLIEMLVVVGVFSTASLIVSTLYVSVSSAQRRAGSVQRVIEDARFAVEAIGQQIRLGTINYNYYMNHLPTDIDLHPSASAKPYTLALLTPTNDKLYFRRSSLVVGADDGQGDKLQTCTEAPSNDCSPAGGVWQDVTPPQVKVMYLTFQIWPSADPFSDPGTAPNCSSASPCETNPSKTFHSYRCSNPLGGVCQYATDGKNFQPKVRITLRSEGTESKIAERSRVNIQTLFSTRAVKNKLQNTSFAP